MAVIKLKMGIKDVVRKDTLTAENPGSIAINLSVSGLLVLTLYPTPPQIPPFAFNLAYDESLAQA